MNGSSCLSWFFNHTCFIAIKQVFVCNCKSFSRWPVVSSSDQLILRSDGTVGGGVGSLCWGPDQKPEVLDYIQKRAPYIP